jgi:hypothetical protein
VSARPKKIASRPARERDLLDLQEHVRKRDRAVADALVEVLTRADPRVLAALGIVVGFAVSRSAKARR